MSTQFLDFLEDSRLGNTGGIFEYFDTEAQNIIIRDTDDALVSTYDTVDLGQWFDSVFDGALRVGNFGLSQFVPRHAYNGEIWAVGLVPTLVPAEEGKFPTDAVQAGFYLFRYAYFRDLTPNLESFDTSEQSENPIKDAGFTIKNIAEEELSKKSSIFASGSRVVSKIGFGDSEKAPLSAVYLDEISWQRTGEALQLSGRNAMGYYLSEQLFDETHDFVGTRTTVLQAMLSHAGIDLKKVFLDPDGDIIASSPKFEPTDTVLSGLTYVTEVWGWKMLELPDGKIIIGSPTFVNTFCPPTIHEFEKDEVFARGFSVCADGAYSRLALQSDIDAIPAVEDPPTPEVPAWVRTVFTPVGYFDSWNLGNHKTLYLKTLANQSQEAMEALIETYADAYQYIGVQSNRDFMLHPEISSGDVVFLTDATSEDYIEKNIITGISHSINVDSATAKTNLTMDSGGKIVDGPPLETYTAANVGGDTRKRELIDVIKKASKQ